MVKISITVGRQLISIEKKEWLCHGVSQPGHKVSLLEIPCCTKQQAEKISTGTVVLMALRDSERRQKLNSINARTSLAFVQGDQGKRDNKEVAGQFPPLLDQVISGSLCKTRVCLSKVNRT